VILVLVVVLLNLILLFKSFRRLSAWERRFLLISEHCFVLLLLQFVGGVTTIVLFDKVIWILTILNLLVILLLLHLLLVEDLLVDELCLLFWVLLPVHDYNLIPKS